MNRWAFLAGGVFSMCALNTLLDAAFQPSRVADLNSDGRVGSADLAILLSQWDGRPAGSAGQRTLGEFEGHEVVVTMTDASLAALMQRWQASLAGGLHHRHAALLGRVDTMKERNWSTGVMYEIPLLEVVVAPY